MIENENWNEDVLRTAEENHIWLNAFQCIRPSDEFLISVGRSVVDKLNDRANLIRPRVALIDSEREVIIRFNKS